LHVLAVEDRLPYVMHRDGTRLYRREQLEVVARSRRARSVLNVRDFERFIAAG
jgi:hypothetical protein